MIQLPNSQLEFNPNDLVIILELFKMILLFDMFPF